jgi:hypothetical protein
MELTLEQRKEQVRGQGYPEMQVFVEALVQALVLVKVRAEALMEAKALVRVRTKALMRVQAMALVPVLAKVWALASGRAIAQVRLQGRL